MRVSSFLFPAAALCLVTATPAALPPATPLPAPLRTADPRTLSSGLYLSLAADGHFGGLLARPAPRTAAGDSNKGRPPVTLDARVGDNLLLTPDPIALPADQRSQAEPHLWRSAADPEFLVGTFQEGRFAAGGGALDCGYALSTDGGLSWTRRLIPNLTASSGGFYVRATDPVAAVDLAGNVFLATLAARLPSFNDGGVVVVSRSTDRGATFASPVAIATGSSTHTLDKEWLAVNDYAGSPRANRLVVTYTDLTSDGAYDLYSSFSDNAALSWSTPIRIKPRDATINQATLPMFFPEGSLLVPYITNYRNGSFRIDCKRSLDGGTTYPATATTVTTVREWVDPSLRTGSFLIAGCIARQSGTAFLTYTGLDASNQPRVFVTRSLDHGATWTAPIIASDDRSGVSVVNPAIAVSPDGQRVTVVFYDKRNDTGSDTVVDLYACLSTDGGAHWAFAPLRLTEYSSDFRVAPLTASGYMLGDYQAVVPPATDDQPAVALTIDTRNNDGDPCAIRYALGNDVTFEAWQLAWFNRAELANASVSGPLADADGDGLCNVAEFFHQTNPRLADFGSLYSTAIDSDPRAFGVSSRHRAAIGPSSVSGRWETSTDRTHWSVAAHTSIPNDFPVPSDNVETLWFSLPDTGIHYYRETSYLAGDPSSAVYGEILAAQTDARVTNLSARGQVKTGDSRLIVGFVTTGGAKAALVRGAGPALIPYGVTSPLADPQLDLSAPDVPSFAIVHNDNWGNESDVDLALFNRLGAFPFPAASPDAAILRSLPARRYTATLSGVADGTGIGMVEIYDADPTPGAPAGPRLANVSARGEVGTGDNVLIGGFVIVGSAPKRVLIRGVGPTLASYGVTGALADPVLTLFRRTPSAEQLIARNDDWRIGSSAWHLAGDFTRLGAFGLPTAGSRDAALVLTLEPGVYSAQVSGVDNANGVALVEIYDAD